MERRDHRHGNHHQDSSFSTGDGHGSSYSWSSEDKNGGGGGGGGGGGSGGSYSAPGPGGAGVECPSGSGFADAGNCPFHNPGYDWSQNQNPGSGNFPFQNPGQAWSQRRFQGRNVADFDNGNYNRNDDSCPAAPNRKPTSESAPNTGPGNTESEFSEELPPSSKSSSTSNKKFQ